MTLSIDVYSAQKGRTKYSTINLVLHHTQRLYH